ncbi:hypothetical protein EDB84DRAFT_1457441 [Lactarius hengduanensis]|nr:hypothetical protein EDB84DRAFT_1457441 [Lactarius hengduanensis]
MRWVTLHKALTSLQPTPSATVGGPLYDVKILIMWNTPLSDTYMFRRPSQDVAGNLTAVLRIGSIWQSRGNRLFIPVIPLFSLANFRDPLCLLLCDSPSLNSYSLISTALADLRDRKPAIEVLNLADHDLSHWMSEAFRFVSASSYVCFLSLRKLPEVLISCLCVAVLRKYDCKPTTTAYSRIKFNEPTQAPSFHNCVIDVHRPTFLKWGYCYLINMMQRCRTGYSTHATAS